MTCLPASPLSLEPAQPHTHPLERPRVGVCRIQRQGGIRPFAYPRPVEACNRCFRLVEEAVNLPLHAFARHRVLSYSDTAESVKARNPPLAHLWGLGVEKTPGFPWRREWCYRRRPMDISETKSGATLVVTPNGRLDAASTPAFHERLLSCIDGGETSVLLDLALLDYISSAGLRSLLTAAKRLQACDGRFALCALTDNVRAVLQVSGFDTIIEIHPDRATALQRLA